MSEPMIMTGSTRERTCACGTVTTQRQMHGAYAGEVHWNTERHDAPCGLPCLAGSVRPAAYRVGEFHKDAERCPRCKPGSDPKKLTAAEEAAYDAAVARHEADFAKRMAELDGIDEEDDI